jgi:hypothetical protein
VSWDVLILHPESASAPEEGHPQLKPLGMADEVRRAVSRALPGIEWPEPLQGSYEGRAVSVRVELPSRGVVDSFALHLRGPGNPLPMLVRICRQNGWVAFDSVAGTFLDLHDPSPEGWESGVLFRAQIYALSHLHRREARSRPARMGLRMGLSRRHLLWLVPVLLILLIGLLVVAGWIT